MKRYESKKYIDTILCLYKIGDFQMSIYMHQRIFESRVVIAKYSSTIWDLTRNISHPQNKNK